MKLLGCSLALMVSAIAQSPSPSVGAPTIAAYQLTSQMCAQRSSNPFFLFAPGFQCTPSVLISIFGMDPVIVRGYAIHVDYVAPDGSSHVETAYVPTINGVASWTFYAVDIRVVRIVVEPQRNADGVGVVTFQ